MMSCANSCQVTNDTPGIKIVTEGNVCLLTIDNFDNSHVGEIICKAENDAGEVI